MPQPWETGLTFRDLITRTAEAMGIASYAAGPADIPTRAHDLDLVKRWVNQGYQRFLTGVRGKDANGRQLRAYTKWTFLRPAHTLQMTTDGSGADNINGDPSRYRVPWNIASSPLSDWNITESSSAAMGTICVFRPAHMVRRSLATSNTTGRPNICGESPLVNPGAPGVDDRGREWVFYPRPDRAYTAQATFRLVPRDLTALDERHVAGVEHDMTILAFCIAEAKRKDIATAGRRLDVELAIADADRMMEASIAADIERMPRSMGQLTDPSTEPAIITHSDARSVLDRGTVTP